MAASDKNIVISPQRGSATLSPSIVFTGDGADPISIYALDGAPGALSFEGSAGQLFSITNSLTSGSIFSVNDVSGIPSFDIDADGTVSIASYGGNVGIGTTSPSSSYKLDVLGDVHIDGNLTITQTTTISGLNADKLDGLDSSQFLRSDAADTASETYTFSNTSTSPKINFTGIGNSTSYNFIIRGQNDAGVRAVHFINGSGRTADGGTDTYTIRNDGGNLRLGKSSFSTLIEGSGDLTFNSNKVWHAGNDGSGSGLDADTLDGIDSGSFLRSDASDTTTGNLTIEGVINCNEINDRTGQQLILNAGEASGKFSGQTGEYVYVNAESGLYISTPDRAHSNFQSGYTQDITIIRGEYMSISGNTVWHAGNDGSGSGLDADTLDGAQPNVSASNNTIVQRHSSGYIYANYFNTTPDDVTSGVTKVCVETGNDGFIRHGTADAIRSFLNIESGATGDQSASEILTAIKTVDGSGSGLDADLLDGINSGSFLRSDAADTASGNLLFSSNYTRFVSGSTNNTSTADTNGLYIHIDGIYEDGRYTHRLRKYDQGGGVPLYIDASSGTANVFTALARFGTYAGNNYEFEVFGDINATGNLYDGGNAVWHAGNDGSGSGLDADTLDGIDSSSFLRSDANDTFTGILDINGTVTIDCGDTTTGLSVRSNSGSSNSGRINLGFGNGTNNPKIQFDDVNNDMFWGIGAHDSPNNLYIWGNAGNSLPSFENHTGGTTSSIQFEFTTGGNLNVHGSITASNGNTVWHAGNDGSGSGLDADTVDGIQGGSFLRSDTADTSSRMISFYTNMSSQEDYANSPISIRERDNAGSGDGEDRDSPNLNFHWSGRASKSLWMGSNGWMNWGEYNSSGIPTADGTFRAGNLLISTSNHQVWHAGNDGSGSGLDADTVDGINSESFLRSDANDSFTGTITNSGNFISSADSVSAANFNKIRLGRNDSQFMSFYGNASGNSMISISQANNPKANLRLGYSVDGGATVASEYWFTGSSGDVWHSGNDGSGSGLDADTLDGQQGSYYLDTSATAQTKSGGLNVSGKVGIGTTNPSDYSILADNLVIAGTSHEGISIISGTGNSGNIWFGDSDAEGRGQISYQHLIDRLDFSTSGSGHLYITSTGNVGIGTTNPTEALEVIGNVKATSFLGNATTSGSLATARTISITGDGSGSASFDGSADVSISLVVANDSHTHDGRYFTETESDARYLGISAKAADSNLLDGQQGSYYLDYNNLTNVPAGSGNADTLDNLDSTQFLRSDADDTFTGVLDSSGDASGYRFDGRSFSWNSSMQTPTSNVPHVMQDTWSGWDPVIGIKTQNGFWQFGAYTNDTLHLGYMAGAFGSHSTNSFDNSLAISPTNMSFNENTVWHAGNDGSGSGLDADTLDGYHGSNYIGLNGNSYFQLTTWLQSTSTHGFYSPNSGAGTHFYPGGLGNYGSFRVDGQKSGWSGISLEGNIVFMHNGTTAAGIYNDVDNEWMFYGVRNSYTRMYHNGSSKVQTTSSGVTVTGNVNSTSDIKLKKNIETIDNALDKVLKLRGVYFDWKEEEMETNRNIGLIAQEVEGVLPEVVTEMEREIKNDDGLDAEIVDTETIKNVSYGNITAILIEAIKEQQKQIEELRSEIEGLKNK